MNKDDIQSKILEFETEIDENGNIVYSKDHLKKLRESGYKNVTIKIFGSSKNAARSLNLNLKKFEQIKIMQNLPDSVVFDFLRSKGSVKSEELKSKLKAL